MCGIRLSGELGVSVPLQLGVPTAAHTAGVHTFSLWMVGSRVP